MNDFSDSLWTEATRDFEAEQVERVQTLATQAATTQVWPFLALAQSSEEFEHRLALADDRLRSIASAHGVSYEDVAAPLRTGFTATLEAREAGLGPKAAESSHDEDEGQRFGCPDCHGEPMWFDMEGGKGIQTCQGACKGSGVVYRKRKADSKGGYSYDDFDFTPAPKTASLTTSAGMKCRECGHSNPTHEQGGVCECGCRSFEPNKVTASFDDRIAMVKRALEEGQDPLAWLADGAAPATPTHHDTVQQFLGDNPVAYDAAMGGESGVGTPENEMGHQEVPDSVRTAAKPPAQPAQPQTNGQEPDPFA